MSDDKTEITRLVNLYIDGAGKGDASKEYVDVFNLKNP